MPAFLISFIAACKKYEREKKQDETNRAIAGVILAVVGAIIVFVFSKILAPIVSKHPFASFILMVAIGLGCYFYFTRVDDFDDFSSKFSQNESYCRQHISQVVISYSPLNSVISMLHS